MIEIEHLSKVFQDKNGRVVALEDVSATIRDGDIFGIIGMSGAGKSTLLRCLCLLETPTEGRILLDGKDLSALRGEELRTARRRMGVVFQGYNLLMQKTVAENVAFPLKLDKYDKAAVAARVTELLELVGLADKAQSYPSQLSGGQKQRVALARALASNPGVLLCDEPTSAPGPADHPERAGAAAGHQPQAGRDHRDHHPRAERWCSSICNRMVVIDDEPLFVEQGETAAIFENPQSSSGPAAAGQRGGAEAHGRQFFAGIRLDLLLGGRAARPLFMTLVPTLCGLRSWACPWACC